MSQIQVEPITLRQHLLHPFSFKVTGARNFIARIPVNHRFVALIAAVATAILGIPFAIVGGPLVFYFFTRQFKNRRIEQVQQNNVPRPPSPTPQPGVGGVPAPVGNLSSPMHEACAKGRVDQVRALIAQRANLSAVDSSGNSPLHIAAKNGHHAIVQLLLANGADANSRNHAWKSPLALAVEKALPTIVVGGVVSNTQGILNAVCTHGRARENLDKLVEALLPFAKYDVVRHLIANPSLTATQLSDRIMLSILRNQYLANAGDPVTYDRLIREQPFIFSLDSNEVIVSSQESPIPVILTKQQFYHVWVQFNGDLNRMKIRILEHNRQPIQIPVPVVQPVVGGGNRNYEYNGPVFKAENGEYQITLTREEFKEKPDWVLERLCQLFDQAKYQRLKIKFPEENGIDAGGLRRQFVADIFSHMSEKVQFQKFANGLYRPRSRESSQEFPYQNANDKKACENLGKMIMFCLNTYDQYPTGLIFDPGTFVALSKMDAKFIDKKFEDINFEDEDTFKSMFKLFKDMNAHDEDENNKIARSERYLNITDTSSDEDLKGAWGLVMLEDDIKNLPINGDVAKIKQNLAAIKRAVKSSIIEDMKPTFAPIHAILKGMKNSGFNNRYSFQQVRYKKAADLSKDLQGIAKKEDIIKSLVMHNGHDPFGGGAIPATESQMAQIKTWMTNWINQADPKKLELFLFAVTGSPALGGNTRIVIKHVANRFAYHTCYSTVDVNFNVQKEKDFQAILDNSLIAVQHSPIFDMA